ncbi:MAG: hypothetical protein ACE5GR_07840 [Nitrosopumilus sp.]
MLVAKVFLVFTFAIFFALTPQFSFAETGEPSKLNLILPSDTFKVNSVPAFVVLTDDDSNPVLSESDLHVDIRTFGNVHTDQSSVMISKNTHIAKFLVNIDGDGGIAIASSGFVPDTKNVYFQYEDAKPELQVRVAPNPIPPSSTAEVYVWIEQNEKPYIPDRDISIQLISEDEDFLTFSDVGRFNSNPTTDTLKSTQNIVLKSGESFAKAKVFSTDFISEFNPNFGPDLRHAELEENEANEFLITALADGFEGKQADIRIQPAKILTANEISNNVQADPTVTKIWAYPSTAFDDFEIVMAVYTQTVEKERKVSVGTNSETEELEQNQLQTDEDENEESDETSVGGDEEDQELSNSCSFCAPVIISDADIRAHVSSNELITNHQNSVKISSNSFIAKENYVVIPAKTNGMLGDGQISGAFDGTAGDIFEIKIEQPFDLEPTLGITSIPSIANQFQDILMVYGLEDNVVSSVPIRNLVVSTNPALDVSIDDEFETVKVVNGFTGTLGKEIDVMALSDGLIPTSVNFEVYSEPFDFDAQSSKTSVLYGDVFEITYKELPSYLKVELDSNLPFEQIENGFRLRGFDVGEQTIRLLAKSGDEILNSKEFSINVLPLESTTNSVEVSQTRVNDAPINDKFLENYLLYFLIPVGIMPVGIFMLKNKTKKRKEFSEEDLTF